MNYFEIAASVIGILGFILSFICIIYTSKVIVAINIIKDIILEAKEKANHV